MNSRRLAQIDRLAKRLITAAQNLNDAALDLRLFPDAQSSRAFTYACKRIAELNRQLQIINRKRIRDDA